MNLKDLKEWNKLIFDKIIVGEKLIIFLEEIIIIG